ncbi:MAG: hypothetical protein IT455_02245 [Planctomycetes bacterium]|nr:hypothetical protein [Planctomycetota bacterium]
MSALARLLPAWLPLALAACATSSADADQRRLWAAAPAHATARLWLADGHLAGVVVPTGGPGSMPLAVRTTLRAVAPDGETLFEGREWGPAGTGWRIEKRYHEDRADHLRSLLIAADGRVLERDHTVPLAAVPPAVLATALPLGPIVDEARIVSDGDRETHWLLVVRDRDERVFVAKVGLRGEDLGHLRRLPARIDG